MVNKNDFDIHDLSKELLKLVYERLRILSKSKSAEVLVELAQSKEGKKFTDLIFDLRINSSALSSLLKSLTEVDYVLKKEDLYRVTIEGNHALLICIGLVYEPALDLATRLKSEN